MFLRMQGTGAAGNAPVWDTVTKADVGLSNVSNESKTVMFDSPSFTGTAYTAELTITRLATPTQGYAYYGNGGNWFGFNGTNFVSSVGLAINTTGSSGSCTGNAATASNLTGTPTVPNGTAATTQAINDNSTKLATTAYVDRLMKVPTAAENAQIWPSSTGKCVHAISGFTFPSDTMAEGDTVTVYNTTASTITLTPGNFCRMAGTALTGARSLAGYGMATIRWISASECVISGAGLS
jgi:hypothetical protein